MWESVREWWQAAGVKRRPGAKAADLDAFERRYGIRLPPDVRTFYAEADGMPDGAWDDVFLRFWPLTEVGPVPVLLAGCRGVPVYHGIEASLPDANSYFVFADHSIWVHLYAVRLCPDPSAPCPVVWIGGRDRWQVLASSFGDFLRSYAAEPQQVLFPQAETLGPEG